MSLSTGALDGERYISLETFKRDGVGVRTPVWAAPLDGRLVVFTAGDSFKVKRLRRNPKIRAAACDARGKVKGSWLDGEARILEDADHIARAHAALIAKYGWQARILDFFSALSGRKKSRAFLEIKL
jgi:PPOX class probable F420-dependent enzyme